MSTEIMGASPGYAARTHPGRVRTGNEDSHLARPPLFVVADGLGGHQGGEVASAIAVEELERAVTEGLAPTDLTIALQSASRAVREAARARQDLSGMGTTCTALLLDRGSVHIAHVGDSRAYRFRRGALAQLTEDHTVVAELIREGIIDEQDAGKDERRHVLTQALGLGNGIKVETRSEPSERGDRYLLCSDGLSGYVPDDEIEAVLAKNDDPGLAADRLVELANQAGGYDNVTVIVIDADVVSLSAGGREPVVATTAARPAEAGHLGDTLPAVGSQR